MRYLEINNCKHAIEYKCPLFYEKLEATGNKNIKFCNECKKNVYRCNNNAEIEEHIKKGHCIATTIEEQPLMGVLLPPDEY